MAARELKQALRYMRTHFKGRHGNPTGDVEPYAKFMLDTVRSNKDAKEPDVLLKDLESYSYYLSALVDKKRLLSSFGGDSVRGISAKQRIENTSGRVGLKLPQGSFQTAQSAGSVPRLRPGERKPTLKSLREELSSVVQSGLPDPKSK